MFPARGGGEGAAGEAGTARQVALDRAGLERALFRPPADSEAFLDTRGGDVFYVTRGWSDDHGFSDGELAEGLAAGRLVAIEPLPRETQLGWMRGFAGSLEDGWARDALDRALGGEAPLRAFEDALGRFPAERLGWIACREARVQAVLRAWLEANDLADSAQGLDVEPLERMEG